MSFELNSDMSVAKREVVRVVHRHLQPSKIETFHSSGIDLVIGKREGYRLWDMDGRELLDLHLNGGVFSLGHRNPELVKTLTESLSNFDIGNHHFPSEPKARLAEALIASCPGNMRYAALTASGSEAVDIAIKSARWATGRTKIVSLAKGYHGNSGISGCAGDDTSAAFFHSGGGGDFIKVPFNDVESIGAALAKDDVAAVILETIPATFGFPVPCKDYFPAVRDLCNRHGSLLIVDEVQTGLGRTGKLWAIEHWETSPDILVTGKGLSGGLYPIAAAVMSERAGAWLQEDGFKFVSTFGGSDLGCCVALKALEISGRAETLANVERYAAHLRQGIDRLRSRFPFLVEVRQLGLVMGLRCSSTTYGKLLMRSLYECGIWAIVAGYDQSVVQFKPGLLIDLAYCDQLLSRIEMAFAWLVNNKSALIMGGEVQLAEAELSRLTSLAKEAAATHWGKAGATVQLLKHRENSVFKVVDSAGEQSVLRIHRIGYHTAGEIESELSWMSALAASGYPVPSPLKTRSGAPVVALGNGSTDGPCATMLSWVPGRPVSDLGDVKKGVNSEYCERYRELGSLAARLHNHGEKWQRPKDFSRPEWSKAGLLGENPVWGRFWEHPLVDKRLRKRLDMARVALASLLDDLGTGSEVYGLIHADFLPENVLVERSRFNVIDFDDSGFGWFLFEMATSLIPHVGEPYFDDIVAAYVAGYRVHRHFSDEHLALLPAFILLRVLTYLGFLHTKCDGIQNADRVAAEIVRVLSDEALPGLLQSATRFQKIQLALGGPLLRHGVIRIQ